MISRAHDESPPAKVVGTSKPVLSTMYTLASRRRPPKYGAGWQSVRRSTAGGAWGPRARRFVDPVLEATHRPPPSSGGASVPDEDARMPKTHHPYLTATLGEAALRLPPELAQPLEAAFAAANEAPAPINLPGCLQRIQAGDAADGQPWQGPAGTPGDAVAAARRDRAAVGLVSLLELYHAAERVRVDGEEKDDIGDGTREGLMLACRGLAEYVALQVVRAQ